MPRIYLLLRTKSTANGMDIEMVDWYTDVKNAVVMKKCLNKQDRYHAYFIRKIAMISKGELSYHYGVKNENL